MDKTARIAAVVALASILAAVPARALSLKDWEAKSNRDQIEYLSASFARLVIAVGKTDQPLAQKIRSYYGDKVPGAKYPEGFLDLQAQIGRLENQAKTDRSVDLSKIEIEDVILRTTAVKFGNSNPALKAGKSAGNGPAAPAKRESQPAGPPRPPANPAGPKADTTSGGFGDQLGPGGFVRPPVYKVSAFDPAWLGSTRTVEGTVSRVTVDGDYVIIYFRESPDGGFTGFSRYIGMLQKAYGSDFARLTGLTVQIDGEIQQFRGSKGSVRIVDLKQIKLP